MITFGRNNNSFGGFNFRPPSPPKPKVISIKKSNIFHIYKSVFNNGVEIFNVEVICYEVIKHIFKKELMNVQNTSYKCNIVKFIKRNCFNVVEKLNKNEILFQFYYQYIPKFLNYYQLENMRAPMPRPTDMVKIMRYIKKDNFVATEKPKPETIFNSMILHNEFFEKKQKTFLLALNDQSKKEELCLAQCYFIRDLLIFYFEKIGIKITDSSNGNVIVNVKENPKVIIKEVQLPPKVIIKEVQPKLVKPTLTPERSNTLTCRICFENKINTIILDCGHSCLCSTCAYIILDSKKECPMCRTQIKKGIRDMYI